MTRQDAANCISSELPSVRARPNARHHLSSSWMRGCFPPSDYFPSGNRPLPNDVIERGAKIVILDREKPGDLAKALSPGADAVIDTIAFHSDHAR